VRFDVDPRPSTAELRAREPEDELLVEHPNPGLRPRELTKRLDVELGEVLGEEPADVCDGQLAEALHTD